MLIWTKIALNKIFRRSVLKKRERIEERLGTKWWERERVRTAPTSGWRAEPGGWPRPGASAARTQYLSILWSEISIGCASSVFFTTLASHSNLIAARCEAEMGSQGTTSLRLVQIVTYRATDYHSIFPKGWFGWVGIDVVAPCLRMVRVRYIGLELGRDRLSGQKPGW